MVHPKGSWVPYKPFPSQKILGNLVGDQSLHKVMFFGPPFWAQKGPRASQALDLGLGAPKMGSGVKNIKVGDSKTMQNPLVNAPNGAICCKLWPQTILGWGPQILGGNPFLLGNPSAPGAGYEGFKVALGWHGAPFGGGLGSGPHVPRKCCKTIVFYSV